MSDDLCIKRCGEYIVRMSKLHDTITNESRENIIDIKKAIFIADRLLVESITNAETNDEINEIENTFYSKKVKYIKGEVVQIKKNDQNSNKIDKVGIHYFKTYDAAYHYNRRLPKDYTGSITEYNDDGGILREYTYKDGKRDGITTEWRWLGNKKYKIEMRSYLDGKLHGKNILWFSNGNKQSMCEYNNGICTGLYVEWYENGIKKEEYIYDESGLRQGLYRMWNENGGKYIECEYTDGLINGPYEEWAHDNNKQIEYKFKTCKYIFGKIEGTSVVYSSGGKKYIEEQYKNGERNGIQKYWTGDRKKCMHVTYVDGKIITKNNYLLKFDIAFK